MQPRVRLMRTRAAAEALRVALVDPVVVLRLLDLTLLVGVVEARGALGPEAVFAGDRLAAAGDAAARAGHHFDEVELRLAGLDLLDQFAGVGKAVHHRDAELFAGDFEGRFLARSQAAGLLEIDLLKGFAADLFDREAQGRFHHAAGGSEDHAAAGGEAERHVESRRFEFIEFDSHRFDHRSEFYGGQHVIDLGTAVALELRQLRLEFLRGAGHHRNHDQIFRLHAELGGQGLAGDRAEDGLRRTGGGDVRQHFRVESLRELHPRRAAAGEHRQLAAGGQALDEFGGFLEDGHIRREAGVVDVVEAHHLHRGNHPAGHVFTGLETETFAEADADRRGDLHDHDLLGIVDRFPHLVGVGLRDDRAGRADLSALAAVHAFAFAQVVVEGRNHAGVGAAAGEIQRADALHFGADAHAVAAEHALVRVAHQRRAGGIQRQVLLGLLVADVLHAELAGEVLQRAVRAALAGRAFAVVAGEQQLDVDLAHVADRLGVGLHDHARLRLDRAGGHDAAPLDVHEAEAAGTVDRKFRMIAEGRDVDAGLADHFEEVPLVAEFHLGVIDGESFLHFAHFI